VLKGSREGVVRRIQPVSIHGQVSYDIHYTLADEEQGPVHAARVGPEALSPRLQPGDKVRIDFLLGAVTGVTTIG
jgi:hypothetical protein